MTRERGADLERETRSLLLPRVIHTRRLVLRRPEIEDAPAIFEGYAQDPDVVRYLTWRPHRSIQETREFLRGRIDAWSTGPDFAWVITRLIDSRVIGMIEATVGGYLVSIGYVLAKSEWGNGYMTEAAGAVLEAAISLPGVSKVNAMCDVQNIGSARVLEKIGMTREARLRSFVVHPNVSGEPRDVYVYAKGTSPALIEQ